jgi:hypothetical protein
LLPGGMILESGKPSGRFVPVMIVLKMRLLRWWAIGGLCAAVSGCGLILLPVRIAGGVVEGTYRGTKRIVNASSDSLEKRAAKKAREKKKAEAGAAVPSQPPTDIPATENQTIPLEQLGNPPPEGPIIPVD